MEQLDMLSAPVTGRAPERTFIEGVLGGWFEARVGRPPRKTDRAVLRAAAENMLVGFEAQVIAARAADERKKMSEHDLSHRDDDGAPEEIREGVSLPGADVEVPDEIEERLRERPETQEEQELDG